jgi:hypothetical protein
VIFQYLPEGLGETTKELDVSGCMAQNIFLFLEYGIGVQAQYTYGVR